MRAERRDRSEPADQLRFGRWRRIAAAALVVVALLATGWGAALVFQSPAQVEAHRQAPPPSDLTAQVSEGELARNISAQVTYAYEIVTRVPFVPVSERDVITASPLKQGDAVAEFTVVAGVNDRPRFATSGSFPYYRDLTEGDQGADVRQLQTALAAAGYRVDADGSFGAQTTNAITEAYKQSGYVPPMTSELPSKSEPGPTEPGTAPASKRKLSVPLAELLVVPVLPADLLAPIPVGAILADTTALDVGAGRIVAIADVNAATATHVRSQMKGTLTGLGDGPKSATVIAVNSAEIERHKGEGAKDQDERWSITLVPDTEPQPRVVGSSGVAHITTEIAAPRSLIVPTSAMVTAGRGSPHVLKLSGDRFVRVEVRELGSMEGRTAIEPTTSGELAPDDRVKIG